MEDPYVLIFEDAKVLPMQIAVTGKSFICKFFFFIKKNIKKNIPLYRRYTIIIYIIFIFRNNQKGNYVKKKQKKNVSNKISREKIDTI